MSSPQAGNVVDILGPALEKAMDSNIIPRLDMDSTDLKNLEKDFQLSTSDLSGILRKDTTDVLNYHGKKSIRKDKFPTVHSLLSKPSSSIPLPVKSPKSPPLKVPSQQPLFRSINRSARPSSVTINRTNQVTNRHTLEIQFINKKKRLSQLKKDLVEKQKPVLDLYQNLLQIKKRLEELGKVVQLEEVKLMPFNDRQDQELDLDASGERITPEVVMGMQNSIEEIPKTLMEICKNLLSRRAVIVDLLESVTKSEVDVGDLSDKIETLKIEGTQLQNNLDAIICEHEKKINMLVINWQALLNDKKRINTNCKIEDLEDKLKSQERLAQESNLVILELQRKLDDKKISHEKSVAELNNVIYTLREQILKLEQELELERKAANDIKNRNSTNAQNSKLLRNKITELETEKKTNEATNGELNKKVRLLQDQIKHKEAQWTKEKEDLTKNLKHQENLLQKVTADKNKFETRCLIHITLRAFSEFLIPYPLL